MQFIVQTSHRLHIGPRPPRSTPPPSQKAQGHQRQADDEAQKLKDVVGLGALAAADEVRVVDVVRVGAVADVAVGLAVIVLDAAAVEDLVGEAGELAGDVLAGAACHGFKG